MLGKVQNSPGTGSPSSGEQGWGCRRELMQMMKLVKWRRHLDALRGASDAWQKAWGQISSKNTENCSLLEKQNKTTKTKTQTKQKKKTSVVSSGARQWKEKKRIHGIKDHMPVRSMDVPRRHTAQHGCRSKPGDTVNTGAWGQLRSWQMAEANSGP